MVVEVAAVPLEDLASSRARSPLKMTRHGLPGHVVERRSSALPAALELELHDRNPATQDWGRRQARAALPTGRSTPTPVHTGHDAAHRSGLDHQGVLGSRTRKSGVAAYDVVSAEDLLDAHTNVLG